jgi:peptidoglycan/LPS O-acetylase OafA/YrhL
MLGFMDMMRGIAILMVLATHVAASIPGLSPGLAMLAKFGQTGVQMFFVASAYTLSLSWQRRVDEPHRLARFALRRWFRIAPMYFVGVALFAALHFTLQAGAASVVVDPYTPWAVAANLLLIHGFVPAANNAIVPGGWSIGTEIAFYAAFPLLIGPFTRLGERHGWRAMVGLVLATAALNLVWQIANADALTALAPANNSFAYFHIVNQLPVFLVGLTLFRWHAAEPRAGAVAGVIAFVAATAVALALWRSAIGPAFALVPVVVAVAYAGLAHALSRSRIDARWLRRIGQVSFSMYIVHTLFAWHAERALIAPLSSLLSPDLQLPLLFALVVIASYLVARWTEHAIEAPGVKFGARICDRLVAAPETPVNSHRSISRKPVIERL